MLPVRLCGTGPTAVRIQQVGKELRLRVLLFRRDDVIAALSPFLGADFVNIVTDKATDIKVSAVALVGGAAGGYFAGCRYHL